MYNQEPRHPRFNFNNLFNKHFSLAKFFKNILSRENRRDEMDCYLKLVGGEGRI